MKNRVTIELYPWGKVLEVERGTALQDILFAQGIEFPCGGRGRCCGCKVKVLKGHLPLTPEAIQWLSAAETAKGWRLACQCTADEDLVLEIAQWEATILADNTEFEVIPQAGLGIAIDLGTTTLVAQLLDLRTGQVLGVRTALNQQARYGADIMSRIQHALDDSGRDQMKTIIRTQLGGLIHELLSSLPSHAPALKEIIIVGNTVMHHLFCGITVEPLSHYPFETAQDGLQTFLPVELGWNIPAPSPVRFLPCLGGFVGSDILAGILATRLHEKSQLTLLIDLGTNGEIVAGNAHRIVCASTAAGPAFEGARISMGMRAVTGAISAVGQSDGQIQCQVIGHTEPRGLCGSGLVDAAAIGLTLGLILPNGRISSADRMMRLLPPVTVTQADIRELQLAKGAIAAGIRHLLDCWGEPGQIGSIFLAGAFGNYISRHNARRIGLYPFDPEKVSPAGNTALQGAKLALFSTGGAEETVERIRQRVQHVSLSADPRFQDIYAEEMSFPDS